MHGLVRILAGAGVILAVLVPISAALQWLFDHFPSRRTAHVYGACGWLCLALAVGAAVLPVAADANAEAFLVMWICIAPGLLIVAAAFFGARIAGLESLKYVAGADGMDHWRSLLRDGRTWWDRSRAARELGRIAPRVPAARAALVEAGREESNRHVRAAIRRGLRAAPV